MPSSEHRPRTLVFKDLTGSPAHHFLVTTKLTPRRPVLCSLQVGCGRRLLISGNPTKYTTREDTPSTHPPVFSQKLGTSSLLASKASSSALSWLHYNSAQARFIAWALMSGFADIRYPTIVDSCRDARRPRASRLIMGYRNTLWGCVGGQKDRRQPVGGYIISSPNFSQPALLFIFCLLFLLLHRSSLLPPLSYLSASPGRIIPGICAFSSPGMEG